jgi:hypothetical protein
MCLAPCPCRLHVEELLAEHFPCLDRDRVRAVEPSGCASSTSDRLEGLIGDDLDGVLSNPRSERGTVWTLGQGGDK